MKKFQFSAFVFLALTIIVFSACDNGGEEPETPINLPAEELSCDYFTQGENRTLTDDPNKEVDYIITCRAFVGTDLVIEPGVVIEFQNDAGLEIGDDGSISALGTSDNPIILTGVDKIAGSWSGILVRSNDVKNEMEYVTISYGGGSPFNSNDNRANLILWSGSRLSIDNCMFSHSATYGIEMGYQDYTIPSFTGNSFKNNETPIYTKPETVHMFDGTSDYTENINDYIVIGCAFLPEGDFTWKKINVPFRVVATDFGITRRITMGNQSSLNLEPGVTLQFDTDTELRIDDGGSLKAVGTENDKITFTGVDGGPGAWSGIYFAFTQSINNQLDHCIIEYAGSGNDKAGVKMWADPKLSVTNTLFSEIDGCGILEFGLAFDNSNFSGGGNTFVNVTGGDTCNK